MLAGRLSHLFMLTPQGVDQAYLALDHDGRRLLVARR